jgi:hypothetical protein
MRTRSLFSLLFVTLWQYIIVVHFSSSSFLVSGWTIPRLKLTSPMYHREYKYWKKLQHNNKQTTQQGAEEQTNDASIIIDESYTFSQVFEKHGGIGCSVPWQVLPFCWKLAYRIQIRLVLPILHMFDDIELPNSSLCLPIMWWKALLRKSGTSSSNPDDDPAAWAHDLLPPSSRWIVRYFRNFFPPLHHQNIQLRTNFLDSRIKAMAAASKQKRIRLVILGAGYDLRTLRFLKQDIVQQAIEVDLDYIIEAKKILLDSSRFQRSRPNCRLPQMAAVDLNNIDHSNITLSKLLLSQNHDEYEDNIGIEGNDDTANIDDDDNDDIFNIFLLEGILVHLEAGTSSEILKILRSVCEQDSNGCLIFCDRIQGVDDQRLDLAQKVLAESGWDLIEFLSTPTKTPHFGVAIPR